MKLIMVIFQWLNLGALVAVFTLGQQSYRRQRSGPNLDLTAEERLHFVHMFYLVCWWAAGTVAVWILEANPFWILAWLFVGFIIGSIADHLFEVMGLKMLLLAGELHKEQLAEEIASKSALFHEAEDLHVQGEQSVQQTANNEANTPKVFKVKDSQANPEASSVRRPSSVLESDSPSRDPHLNATTPTLIPEEMLEKGRYFRLDHFKSVSNWEERMYSEFGKTVVPLLKEIWDRTS